MTTHRLIVLRIRQGKESPQTAIHRFMIGMNAGREKGGTT